MQIFKNLSQTIFKLFLLWLWVLSVYSCGLLDKGEETPKTPGIKITAQNLISAVGVSQTISLEILPEAGSVSTDSTDLTVNWQASAGTISKLNSLQIDWKAPIDTMQVIISAIALNPNGGESTAQVIISVGNAPPKISGFTSSTPSVLLGNPITMTCQASDPEGFDLTYRFEAIPDSGVLVQQSSQAANAIWTAPEDNGIPGKNYQIICEVSDHLGFITEDTLDILVYSEYESIWVVDSGAKKVEKYTANGLKVLTAAASFQKPVAVTNNIEDFYGCYVADFDAAAIYKIDAFGQTMTTITGLSNVIDLAMHQDTQTIWAISVGDNSLTVIDAFQDVVIKKIKGFDRPRWIYINQASGDVWVSEQGNNRLIQLSAPGLPNSLPDSINYTSAKIYPDSNVANYFNSPFAPNVKNEIGKTVYVADRNDFEIERFDWNNGAYTRNINPINLVSLEPRSVNVSTMPGLGTYILIVSFDGKISVIYETNLQYIITLSGNYAFKVPHAVTVDQTNSQCWIGDNGSNQLVKLRINTDNSYTVLNELNGFIFIEDIVINK